MSVRVGDRFHVLDEDDDFHAEVIGPDPEDVCHVRVQRSDTDPDRAGRTPLIHRSTLGTLRLPRKRGNR